MADAVCKSTNALSKGKVKGSNVWCLNLDQMQHHQHNHETAEENIWHHKIAASPFFNCFHEIIDIPYEGIARFHLLRGTIDLVHSLSNDHGHPFSIRALSRSCEKPILQKKHYFTKCKRQIKSVYTSSNTTYYSLKGS